MSRPLPSSKQIIRALPRAGRHPGDDDTFTDRTRLRRVIRCPTGTAALPFAWRQVRGRVDAFWKLRDSLSRESTTIFQGSGVIRPARAGLGKTQSRIEYAHRFDPLTGRGLIGSMPIAAWVRSLLRSAQPRASRSMQKRRKRLRSSKSGRV